MILIFILFFAYFFKTKKFFFCYMILETRIFLLQSLKYFFNLQFYIFFKTRSKHFLEFFFSLFFRAKKLNISIINWFFSSISFQKIVYYYIFQVYFTIFIPDFRSFSLSILEDRFFFLKIFLINFYYNLYYVLNIYVYLLELESYKRGNHNNIIYN